MRNRYKAVMDHVTVDETMRKRILNQIAAVDLECAPKGHGKGLPLLWKAVACIALLSLAGGIAAYGEQGSRQPQLPENRPGHVAVVSPITSVDTAQELAELVGFPIDALEGLPFEPESVTCTALHQTVAQCLYQQGERTALLRKARGTEDPSGDYSDYEQRIPLEWKGVTGQLMGKENSFTAAWWTDGTYAWSLTLSEPTAQETWEALISSVLD